MSSIWNSLTTPFSGTKKAPRAVPVTPDTDETIMNDNKSFFLLDGMKRDLSGKFDDKDPSHNEEDAGTTVVGGTTTTTMAVKKPEVDSSVDDLMEIPNNDVKIHKDDVSLVNKETTGTTNPHHSKDNDDDDDVLQKEQLERLVQKVHHHVSMANPIMRRDVQIQLTKLNYLVIQDHHTFGNPQTFDHSCACHVAEQCCYTELQHFKTQTETLLTLANECQTMLNGSTTMSKDTTKILRLLLSTIQDKRGELDKGGVWRMCYYFRRDVERLLSSSSSSSSSSKVMTKIKETLNEFVKDDLVPLSMRNIISLEMSDDDVQTFVATVKEWITKHVTIYKDWKKEQVSGGTNRNVHDLHQMLADGTRHDGTRRYLYLGAIAFTSIYQDM